MSHGAAGKTVFPTDSQMHSLFLDFRFLNICPIHPHPLHTTLPSSVSAPPPPRLTYQCAHRASGFWPRLVQGGFLGLAMFLHLRPQNLWDLLYTGLANSTTTSPLRPSESVCVLQGHWSPFPKGLGLLHIPEPLLAIFPFLSSLSSSDFPSPNRIDGYSPRCPKHFDGQDIDDVTLVCHGPIHF